MRPRDQLLVGIAAQPSRVRCGNSNPTRQRVRKGKRSKDAGFLALCRSRRRYGSRTFPEFWPLPQPQRECVGIDCRKITPAPASPRDFYRSPTLWSGDDCNGDWDLAKRRRGQHVAQTRRAPAPLAVWSLSAHPSDNQKIFAGYEPCAICFRSDDGASWETLPVEVTFPEIAVYPEPMPKRVLGVAVDPTNRDLCSGRDRRPAPQPRFWEDVGVRHRGVLHQ